jgi:hypothetical protein
MRNREDFVEEYVLRASTTAYHRELADKRGMRWATLEAVVEAQEAYDVLMMEKSEGTLSDD